MTIQRGLGRFTGETASVGAALARHSGDLTGAFELMQEARCRFSDENPSNLAVVAEEMADIAVEVGTTSLRLISSPTRLRKVFGSAARSPLNSSPSVIAPRS